MFILCTTFGLVLGLYFARTNLVISIVISLAYLVFVLLRFGKGRFVLVVTLFGIGILIQHIPIKMTPRDQYIGYVIDARDNYYLFQTKFERYYVSSKDNTYEIGDKLVLKGEVKPLKITTYESRFDFGQYLNNKGVTRELIVKDCDEKHLSLIRSLQFKKKVLSKYDQNTSALISAFVFNDKDYSNSSISIANNNSVIYLFSLSGIYLHVLFAISEYLYKLKFSNRTSRILTFVTFLPLAIFSFTKIGTIRVFSLYLLKILAEIIFKKRKFAHIELVSILALIFLIIDYHLVYQEAFYIGFLLSIIAPITLNATKFIKNKVKRKIISSILISLLIFPIQVKNGIYTPFYTAKTLLLFPLNFALLIVFILNLIFPISKAVTFVAKGIIWILEKMDLYNLHLPFGNWGGAFSIIFITIVLLMVFYLEAVRVKHAKMAGLALLVMTTISLVPLQEPLSNAVYFVNVGQGDSIIIKNRNHTVMIDTGGYKSFDMAKETLIPFMAKKKITHIDALILTHDDFDHSGAKDSLLENFKVKEVLTEKNQFPYKIGNLNIENLNTFDFDEANDNSLVLSLDFIGKKFLFTGDASIKTEEKIMEKYNVDCDILKVGHHGSNTSSSEKFIKMTSPEEAIISCGAKNMYGHPHKEIIDRLNKYNINIRRTDEEGTICYFSLIA